MHPDPLGSTHTHCENCGAPLSGAYCHQCGQHDFAFHRSFRHVFLEALDNFLDFDAKFFRNIFALLFRPGALTAEFNGGKRVVQMPPFRLYLFVAFLFFLLSSAGTSAPKPAAPVVAVPAAGTPGAKPAGKILRTNNPGGLNLSVEEKNGNAFDRLMTEKGRYALGHQAELAEAFTHALPRIFLVCLPFFALYTRVLFRSSRQVYLQHLVLALHFHTFIFLWVLVRNGWGFLAGFASPWLKFGVVLACNLWMLVYPFLMLRRLFGQSWPWTIGKTALLALAYGLTLGLGFVVTAVILLILL